MRRAARRVSEPTILPITGASVPPTGRFSIRLPGNVEVCIEHFAPEAAPLVLARPNQSVSVSGDGSVFLVAFQSAAALSAPSSMPATLPN